VTGESGGTREGHVAPPGKRSVATSIRDDSRARMLEGQQSGRPCLGHLSRRSRLADPSGVHSTAGALSNTGHPVARARRESFRFPMHEGGVPGQVIRPPTRPGLADHFRPRGAPPGPKRVLVQGHYHVRGGGGWGGRRTEVLGPQSLSPDRAAMRYRGTAAPFSSVSKYSSSSYALAARDRFPVTAITGQHPRR